jgi:magnesium-transporting ATPase (P-type)
MLTGDKFETAENIGMSCRLISSDFHVYKMRNANDVELVCDEDTIAINKSLME